MKIDIDFLTFLVPVISAKKWDIRNFALSTKLLNKDGNGEKVKKWGFALVLFHGNALNDFDFTILPLCAVVFIKYAYIQAWLCYYNL